MTYRLERHTRGPIKVWCVVDETGRIRHEFAGRSDYEQRKRAEAYMQELEAREQAQ